MVGVPKSKGCSTCRTRSVKCDEVRPSCSQCRRGGRKCPGYQNRLKFVDENAKLQGRAGRKVRPSSTKAIPESSAASIREEASAHQTSVLSERNPIAADNITGSNSEVSQDNPSSSHVGSLDVLNFNGYRLGLRSFEQEGIVASFVQDLFPLGRLTVQHSFIGSWLWHVPKFLLRNQAMDLAAESLALAYFAKKTHSVEILIRSHNVYAAAIRHLSNAIQDRRSRLASETLCTILLLVHFENFVAMRGKSWITHAGGAGRLIELRGADRHRSGFDRAMYMAARGYLISQAVATGKQCFLDDDQWQYIQIDENDFPLMPRNCTIYHEGLNHFAKIPGVIEKFTRLSNGDPSVYHAGVHSLATKVRSSMMEWFQKLQSDLGLPIRTLLPLPLHPHMVFPSVYEYRDVMTAAFVVNYSAYLLKLNNLLDSINSSSHHLEENITISEDICMSALYCSRAGFCGTQALAFALPLALSALPERYTDSIQYQINIFESIRETVTLRSTIQDETRHL